MQTAHTQGPWYQDSSDETFIRARGDEPGVCAVARVYRRGGWSEQEGNRRLIQAAPELLEELQKAHRLLQLALKHMGGERQALFAAESERVGLGSDGATRYHERAAVLRKATGGAEQAG